MSSVVHAKCKTVEKEDLLKAAKDLGLASTVSGETVRIAGMNFNNANGGSFTYDTDYINKTDARKVVQLASYYTLTSRLKKAGLAPRQTAQNIIEAVKANQKLTLDFEETIQTQVKG